MTEDVSHSIIVSHFSCSQAVHCPKTSLNWDLVPRPTQKWRPQNLDDITADLKRLFVVRKIKVRSAVRQYANMQIYFGGTEGAAFIHQQVICEGLEQLKKSEVKQISYLDHY